MDTLEKIVAKRQRVAKKAREIEKLEGELRRDGIVAIFQALNIPARVEHGYLNHTAGKVGVKYTEEAASYGVTDGHPGTRMRHYYEVTAIVGGVEIRAKVKDATDPSLLVFKHFITTKEV